jgi:arginyl-tRNA synthetase
MSYPKQTDVSGQLINYLQTTFGDHIAEVTTISNFINVRFTDQFILKLAQQLLDSKMYQTPIKKKINVEYVSANPTGNLHLGHLRGIYGDLVASFLTEIGHDVTREYYINDFGNQVRILGQSVFYQYSKLAGFDYPEPSEQYPGDEIIKIAHKLYNQNPNHRDWTNASALFVQSSVDYMIGLIKQELALLGIRYDVWRSESAVYEERHVETAISILKDNGHIRYGLPDELEGDKGNSSNEECLLLQLGDKTKVLARHDGSYTYFAGDLGYYYDKCNRGYDLLIMFLGADHDAHGKQLREAIKGLELKVELEVIITQIMTFENLGEKVKFSKRSGVTLSPSEILEQVKKPELLKFMIYSKSPDTHLSIDVNKLVEISLNNPFYYVQYAYARSCSILRSVETNEYTFKESYPKVLQEFIWKLTQWNLELALLEDSLKVYRIPQYLYEISKLFHFIWSDGKINPECRLRNQENLPIVKLFQKIVAHGFNMMGIQPYESMKDDENSELS